VLAPLRAAPLAHALMIFLALPVHGTGNRRSNAGWFNFPLLHPCFPGNPPTGTLPSWPPDKGYAADGMVDHSTGVRGHVGAHHRMLSTYLNAVLQAGFRFTAFAEADRQLPRILIAQCQKAMNPRSMPE
jgi:hypothetical protein